MEKRKKSFKQQLMAFNLNPKDEEARLAIEAEAGGIACFELDGDKIDVPLTIEQFEAAKDLGQGIEGAFTFAEVRQRMAPQYEADPVDGRPLIRGRTTTKPRVDWTPVAREQRLAIIHARRRGQLPAGSTSETVVDALVHAADRAPWPRLLSEWTSIARSSRPEDRRVVAAVEAEYFHSKERSPFVLDAAAGAPAASEFRARQEDDGSAIRSGDTLEWLKGLLPAQFSEVVFRLQVPASSLSSDTVPQAQRAIELIRWCENAGRIDDLQRQRGKIVPRSTARHVVVLCELGDKEALQSLRLHAAGLAGAAVIESPLDIRPGATLEHEVARMMGEADIVVVMLSSRFMAGSWPQIAQRALAGEFGPGKRVIPIQYSPALVEHSPLGRIRSLPANGKSVKQWTDRDEAWVEIVGALRKVIGSTPAGRMPSSREEPPRQDGFLTDEAFAVAFRHQYGQE